MELTELSEFKTVHAERARRHTSKSITPAMRVAERSLQHGLRLAVTLAPPNTFRNIGGASIITSHHPTKLFSRPDQIENLSFERPIFNPFAKILADWILLHVKPLF